MIWRIYYFLWFLISIRCAAQDNGRGIIVTNAGADQKNTGAIYALIVGISEYEYLQPLKFADKDAQLFRQYLQSQAGGNVPDSCLSFLLNKQAKGGSLLTRGLSWMESRPYKTGDQLYIYLAGHGDAIDKDEYFFLGQDCSTGSNGAKNNYLAGNALQMYNLKNRIARITAKGVRVSLIIDACRTNELPGGKEGQRSFAEGITETRKGEIMMYSAGPGQVAFEGAEIGDGHGLFTWYLMDGMSGEADRNKDGKITLYELTAYVTERVDSDAQQKFKADQIPFFCCSENYTNVVAYVDSLYYTQWVAQKDKLNRVGNKGEQVSRNNKPNNRRGESVLSDTLIIATYNKFMDAIKQNRLIGDSSAAYYYEELKKTGYSSLAEDARYTLAGEYLNYAQGKVNIYLQGKDKTSESGYLQMIKDRSSGKKPEVDFKYKLVATVPYKLAATMLANAFTLLQNDTALKRQLQPQYLFLQAQSYYERNSKISYNEALNNIEKAIRLQPDAAYLYDVLGWLLVDINEYDNAYKAFRQAIQLAPAWCYPYSGLGYLYAYEWKFKEAEKQFQKAIGIDSTYANAYYGLGLLYYNQQKYREAEKQFQKAIKADSAYADAYYNLGNLYYNQQKYREAEKQFQKAIKADSTYAAAYDYLGNLNEVQQNDKEAEKYYRKAIAADSAYADAYYNLGNLYEDQQKYREAEKQYQKAIKVDSSSYYFYKILGNLYEDQQNFREAEKYYRKAIVIDSANVYWPFRLGMIYDNKKEYTKSIHYYRKALSIDSLNADLYSYLGYAYVYNKEFVLGIQSFSRQISLDTTSPDGYYNMACAYSLQNNVPKGFEYLEAAFKKGFSNYQHVLADEDLLNLKKQPEFNTLLKRYFPDKVK